MTRNFTLLALLCTFFLGTHAQNNALSFDGMDDYISTGKYVIPTSGDFTVEFWGFANNHPSTYYEFISQGSSGDAFYVGTQSDGILRLGDAWQNSSYVLPVNQWVHLAVVKTGTMAVLYVNGVQQATNNNYTISGAAGSEFTIGRQYGGHGEYLNGKIDELRIWNVARTQAEIQNFRSIGLTGAQAGLVALYNFNQGSAAGDNASLTVVPDLTTNSNNGTLTNFALTGTTSNFVAGVTGLTPLPLRVTAFSASKQNSVVQLSWSTANEQNMASFEIEKSSNGRSFILLGSVKAAGNSSVERSYAYTDAKPFTTDAYYRLKSVDADGKATYSQVAVVKMNSAAKLDVYPNPVKEVLQLQTNATGKLAAAIYNSAGLLMKKITLNASSGITTLPVDVSTFGKGLYLLQVQSAEGVDKKTFIKY
jgi:hypothetical protein